MTPTRTSLPPLNAPNRTTRAHPSPISHRRRAHAPLRVRVSMSCPVVISCAGRVMHSITRIVLSLRYTLSLSHSPSHVHIHIHVRVQPSSPFSIRLLSRASELDDAVQIHIQSSTRTRPTSRRSAFIFTTSLVRPSPSPISVSRTQRTHALFVSISFDRLDDRSLGMLCFAVLSHRQHLKQACSFFSLPGTSSAVAAYARGHLLSTPLFYYIPTLRTRWVVSILVAGLTDVSGTH
ncbi:hypothetical protein BDN70DRAFT_108522 [Pholiota conissans]|uniref:Uncharacterized protein n=1 Tax=Pholiota conissans TaxID=109636 RepID=A0A9P6CRV7_9AGAR|nr:hypothetical protein BDN70DRAFT_108522 [Pholiota conissans]